MHLSHLDWDYVTERSRQFTGRSWVFDQLRRFLNSKGGRFVIAGLPGTGKTAIASQFIQRESVHAAYLCRSGQVDILDCAQKLSDQLSETIPEFRETGHVDEALLRLLSTNADQIT